MFGTGKKNRRAIRAWLGDCRAFFSGTAAASSAHNWETLHPMSLLYFAYLCFYLFVVCPLLDVPLQTAVVQAFVLLHAVFTLWVFLRRHQPPGWAVELAITLFAAEILGLSGFLGIAIFPGEVSFLFPLCLVLMPLIYTRRPIYPILEVLIPSAVYLLCSRLSKSSYAFFLDAVSVLFAIGIAGSALYSMTNYRLSAYRAQQTLQKMCALDPMTGVNNKPTFEFLAEDFLRSCPPGGYALVMCDLDDFKQINDSHGHRVGDEVLSAFARRLHQLADGDPDLIAGRFGGDEFVLLAKRFSTQQALLDKLGSLRAIDGFDFPVTCSIGIAFAPTGAADFGACFDLADRCLYRAKAGQKGGLCTGDAENAPPPASPR